MKIRTQFLLSLVFFSALVVIVGVSFFFAEAELNKTSRQEKIANDVAQGASELGYLADDYILNREAPQKARWETRFNQITAGLDQIDTSDSSAASLVQDIRTNMKSLNSVFGDISATIESLPQNDPSTGLSFVQIAWSRLQVPTQAIIFDAARLPNGFEDRSHVIQDRELFLVMGILGLVAVYFVSNYFLVNRRTLYSIAQLQAGARFVGAGNLDYVMPVKFDDEIGDLTRSFNKMTASLRTITASRSDLEKEMVKRASAEEELRTANDELQENAQKLEEEIHDRKKAEIALKESEAKAQALIKYAPTGIYEIDFNGPRFISVNEAMSEVSGYTKEELFDIGPMGLLDEASRLKFGDRIRRQAAGESLETNVSYRFRRKDGTFAEVELDVAFSKEKPGTALVIGHDVSERKKAETELRASEERFRNLFEKAPYAVALSSIPEGIYEDVNEAFCNMTGFSRDEIIGKNSAQLNIFRDAESRNRIVAELQARGSVHFAESTIFTKSGEQCIVSTSVEKVTFKGKDYWLNMTIDVTERKKAEESLRESYADLERINRAAVGRELKMVDLKKEINRYYVATGQPPKYTLDPEGNEK
ncbi:PAS domain S-box-containing protein [Dehalogenimonas formicexedens]|uniref:PAS domain S-box-containing protein n=1 Tax=Dehalogenimonas formicexedens TaxID=1839801 RepID=A0A1P8F539_9CHLR|nr:PAS domain S-box protein [Dehalogenimonas formicexedens]APV43601.1 PAS domain S-box-containing protein [Dehalogenimonas formicexedens]